jgi:hypothetical protein
MALSLPPGRPVPESAAPTIQDGMKQESTILLLQPQTNLTSTTRSAAFADPVRPDRDCGKYELKHLRKSMIANRKQNSSCSFNTSDCSQASSRQCSAGSDSKHHNAGGGAWPRDQALCTQRWQGDGDGLEAGHSLAGPCRNHDRSSLVTVARADR